MLGLITIAMVAAAQTGTLPQGQEAEQPRLSVGVAPVAPDQRGLGRVPPEVRTGATVGAVTGLATGILIYATTDCEDQQCAAKTIALPLFIFAYTAVGGLAGAGVGFVVHSLKPADHDEARFTSHATRLGVGLAVSF